MKYTVFLVEDDKKLRETIIDYLYQNEFNVMSATDGEKAIEIYNANNEKIDIVLLDGMLPIVDGIDVLKTIREKVSGREGYALQRLWYFHRG